jgi:putative SOS response-associated peptidase YedK
MCGRVVSTSTPAILAAWLDVDDVKVDEPLPERYNVAPSLPLYAVATRRGADGGRRRQLGMFQWGLVPSWAADSRIGNKLTNARAETVASKPAYREAFARRRAIIPVDAFFEWRRPANEVPKSAKQPKVAKQPYAICRRDRMPMAFAGLWEVWRDPADRDGPPLCTCTIVTTRANDLMAPIHDRMPVVLPAEAWDCWLDREAELATISALLVPCPADLLEAWPVSTLVNRAAVDTPQLLEPLSEGGQDVDPSPDVTGRDQAVAN